MNTEENRKCHRSKWEKSTKLIQKEKKKSGCFHAVIPIMEEEESKEGLVRGKPGSGLGEHSG